MKVQNARIDQVQYIHLGISLAILCLIVPECPSLAYGKAKDVVRVARLSNSKRGNVCSRCGNCLVHDLTTLPVTATSRLDFHNMGLCFLHSTTVADNQRQQIKMEI